MGHHVQRLKESLRSATQVQVEDGDLLIGLRLHRALPWRHSGGANRRLQVAPETLCFTKCECGCRKVCSDRNSAIENIGQRKYSALGSR
jgi:hypothetical protein